MRFLLWALYSRVKPAQLLSQRSAALCVHAQTPTNLVDGLIMEGKHKIMPKHGGLQELKEGGSRGSRHSSFVFTLQVQQYWFPFYTPSFPPPKKKYVLYKWGVDDFVVEMSPIAVTNQRLD